MLKASVLGAVLLAAMSTSVQAFAENRDLPIIGVWKMTSLKVSNADGTRKQIPYSGQVVFSKEGMLSVQAMDHDPAASPTTYTMAGYEAYYGPVTINAQASTFTITVRSSLVRNLIGQQLTRVFQVDDDHLTILPADPKESWRVTYERVR